MKFSSASAIEIPALAQAEIGNSMTREKVKQVLSVLNFSWQGREEGGFASEKVMKTQMGEFLLNAGEDLKLSTEEIWSEVVSANDLANKVYGELNLSDYVNEEAAAYLPYHGLGHAWNTLIGGIKIFLPKLQEIAKRRGMNKEEQLYWIKTTTRALVLHEIDDWWVKADGVNGKIDSAKKIIVDDLDANQIPSVDFDDLIRLDNYVDDVKTQIEKIKTKQVKFLSQKGEDDLGARLIIEDPEMALAIGESTTGSDFMQSLNPNYREKINIIWKDQEIEVPRGSLALALEMFLVAPERIPVEWRKVKEEGWELDYEALGPNYNFVRKIIGKIRPAWHDFGLFNPRERDNAYRALRELFRDVQKRVIRNRKVMGT